jgi:hypothetical protein
MTAGTFTNVSIRSDTAGAVEDLLTLDSVAGSAGNGAALRFIDNSATAGLHLTLGRITASRVSSTTARLDLAVIADPTVSSGDDTPALLSLISGPGSLSVTTATGSAFVVGDRLNVTNAATLGGSLSVTGAATLNGGASIAGNLAVTGAAALNGGANIAGNLAVTGAAALNGDANIAGNLTVTGAAALNGGVNITGDISVTGTVNGRSIATDGALQDQHLANTANPHGTTAAQVGALPSAGGNITGSLGIGQAIPAFAFHVGTNKSVRLELSTTAKLSLGGNGSFEIDAPGVVGGRFVVANDGSVGIGQAIPAFGLHVGANKSVRLELGANAKLALGGNGPFEIDAPGVAGGRFVVANSGNVGIGITNSGFKLDVRGEVRAHGFVPFSDARLKTKITPLTDTLAKLAQMRGVAFEWNERFAVTDRRQRGRQIGVIAQEVEAIFPELVVTSESDGLKAVDYDRLAALLIEAVKELKHKIEMLEQRAMTG